MKVMEYACEIDSETKTIKVITKGELTTTETAAMALKVLIKAKELKYKIIFDYRLSINRISFADAYFWYSKHYDNVDVELRKVPTAYIVNEKDWQFFSFFECTNNNKLIPIKIFRNENTIFDWFNSL